MPGGDRTGPRGEGPMTGRRAGFCAGFDSPGFVNSFSRRGLRRGVGFGRGRGFGKRCWGYNPYFRSSLPTKKEEIELLKEERGYLEKDIKSIDERIKKLKEKKE